MIILKKLTEEQIRAAMARGEFADDVIPPKRNVAVLMTQSWCGQWLIMQHWLAKEARKGADHDSLEIDLFVLEYDQEPHFAEFLAFKEQVFGNTYVPYLRFYRDGRLVKESNYLPKSAFFAVFHENPS